MKKNKILITDPTLRDGNHAVSHQIEKFVIKKYCQMASLSKIPVLEVGHGNGLGGSCLSIGRSKVDTLEAIKIAKQNCNKSKISTHSIPGLSTFDDIQKAKDNGLDIIRIGANATEIDTCIGQVNFSKKLNLDVWVVFMMPHLIANLDEWKKK